MDVGAKAKEHFQDQHAATLHPNYIGVFWWLLALTILEVLAASLPVGATYPQAAKVLILVGLALSKASLVALYFMHLKFERSTLGVIALTPLFLCVFLLFLLIPDSAWR
jgi:cytochrome c oxidase subunit 4